MIGESIRHRRAARIKPGGGRWVGPSMWRAWEAMGPDLVTIAGLAERCGEPWQWARKKLAILEEHGMVRAVGSTTNGQQRVLLWRRVEGHSDGV